ncbi:MAG: hypothetical protein L0177_01470 [Chloroflexi bacterium]|nr:hypothetical protein [Chloroflexota bacterium]
MDENPLMEHRQFPCARCGALLEFRPAARTLVCQYCGRDNDIPDPTESVEELDYHDALATLAASETTIDVQAVQCDSCGAKFTWEPNVASGDCGYCGAAIVAAGGSMRLIKPNSLLVFEINRDEAQRRFRQWARRLWFAPNEFKRRARAEDSPLNGIYIPYWTYDCKTFSRYTGQRGENYKDGDTTKTRWHSVTGVVRRDFDDILVLASQSLPAKYIEKLEPWDFEALSPYQDEYLIGFRAVSYEIGLDEGFEEAKSEMEEPIKESIRKDIGGDKQRIDLVNTSYVNITFKHLLLPVWISAYKHKNKTYRFLINARTGEVQGERPWSALKIIFALAIGITLFSIVGEWLIW